MNSTKKKIQRLKEDRIKCTKYNYSLDSEVQKVCQFDGYLQLSQDGKMLNIFNKKFIRKAEYLQDPDYRVILQKREEYA